MLYSQAAANDHKSGRRLKNPDVGYMIKNNIINLQIYAHVTILFIFNLKLICEFQLKLLKTKIEQNRFGWNSSILFYTFVEKLILQYELQQYLKL